MPYLSQNLQKATIGHTIVIKISSDDTWMSTAAKVLDFFFYFFLIHISLDTSHRATERKHCFESEFMETSVSRVKCVPHLLIAALLQQGKKPIPR